MRMIIKAISTILIFVITTMVLSSCFGSSVTNGNEYRGHYHVNDWYPEGYTAGFGLNTCSPVEFWWVETYEECIDAIALLNSHGSTFSHDSVFLYEGNLFDTKFCFVFSGEKDKIKFGDNPFDRYASDIRIETYAFLEDVSLDDINYSFVYRYEAYKFAMKPVYMENHKSIGFNHLAFKDWESDGYRFNKGVYYKDKLAFFVTSCFSVKSGDITLEDVKTKITDDTVKLMIKSGKIVIINY